MLGILFQKVSSKLNSTLQKLRETFQRETVKSTEIIPKKLIDLQLLISEKCYPLNAINFSMRNLSKSRQVCASPCIFVQVCPNLLILTKHAALNNQLNYLLNHQNLTIIKHQLRKDLSNYISNTKSRPDNSLSLSNSITMKFSSKTFRKRFNDGKYFEKKKNSRNRKQDSKRNADKVNKEDSNYGKNLEDSRNPNEDYLQSIQRKSPGHLHKPGGYLDDGGFSDPQGSIDHCDSGQPIDKNIPLQEHDYPNDFQQNQAFPDRNPAVLPPKTRKKKTCDKGKPSSKTKDIISRLRKTCKSRPPDDSKISVDFEDYSDSKSSSSKVKPDPPPPKATHWSEKRSDSEKSWRSRARKSKSAPMIFVPYQKSGKGKRKKSNDKGAKPKSLANDLVKHPKESGKYASKQKKKAQKRFRKRSRENFSKHTEEQIRRQNFALHEREKKRDSPKFAICTGLKDHKNYASFSTSENTRRSRSEKSIEMMDVGDSELKHRLTECHAIEEMAADHKLPEKRAKITEKKMKLHEGNGEWRNQTYPVRLKIYKSKGSLDPRMPFVMDVRREDNLIRGKRFTSGKMLLTYPYIRYRRQYGKQCIFLFKDNVAMQDILPEPQQFDDYIVRSKSNNYTQTSQQFAIHEVQTDRKETKNSGMLHSEGGWPKEVNSSDNEAVFRVRRRIERGDQYITSMKSLIAPMEQCILQNSAINIHDHFFDDLIPVELTSNYSMRIRNMYSDPGPATRPIRHISWCPTAGNRMAAAYSFAEFELYPFQHPPNPCSYVWDIENPLRPMITLRSPYHVLALEFNHRDPSLLVGGYISGTTCAWDIRSGSDPVLTSLGSASHRYPVTQTLWITSKANTEFFSTSLDGTILWWDIRFLKAPTESLVLDLDSPDRSDIYHAVGITALHFEPTMSSRFLVGTERGEVVNVNRRAHNPMEKLAMRFYCHDGSIINVDRNPNYLKNFLTIGDCSAKVWADDTREGFLFRTRDNESDLTGGCWSKSKASIFFTINTEGMLDAYDVVWGMKAPASSIHISTKKLTAIKSHDDGKFVAIGGQNGSVYLVECSVGMTSFSREDKALLCAHLERNSKYEKMVDSRVKEMKHARDSIPITPPYSVSPPPVHRASLTKSDKIHERDGKRSEKTDKPKKLKRTKSRKSTVVSGLEFIMAENKYFQDIEEYESKFEKIAQEDDEMVQGLLNLRKVRGPIVKEEQEKEDERSLTSQRSRRLYSKKRIVRDRQRWSEAQLAAEESLESESEMLKKRRAKKRGARTSKKVCDTVCKPEICCKDMEEKQRQAEKARKKLAFKILEKDVPPIHKSLVVEDQYYKRLSQYVQLMADLPEHLKNKMLIEMNRSPQVLREESIKAKHQIRKLQGFSNFKKVNSRMIASKMDVVSLTNLEEKSEMLSKRASVKKDEKKIMAPLAKNKIRKRKVKKFIQSDDNLAEQRQEEEEAAKLEEAWMKMKTTLKEMEPKKKTTYPRISAVNEKRSSEDLDGSPSLAKVLMMRNRKRTSRNDE